MDVKGYPTADFSQLQDHVNKESWQQVIPISETFGPTCQGEGPDIGKPCLFLRVHHCPVHCPGCDTYFTWDGSEKGSGQMTAALILERLYKLRNHQPIGLVVSGGEPLLYYKSLVYQQVMDPTESWAWTGLETSGYAGDKPLEESHLWRFLKLFSSVSLSPKVTPCLHGRQTDEQLERNIPLFMDHVSMHSKLFFKFVVRDQADIDAVLACEDRNGFMGKYPVYLMPWGNDRDEILKTTEWLISTCAKFGFIVTPRLQALIWGAERAR